MNLYTKQKQIHRHRKQTFGYEKGKEGRRINQEYRINRYKLLYIKLRSNQDLQCSTEDHGSVQFSSVQFISVAQSCPTLRDPMNRSTPGLPVHHQLPEFTQTHIHQVSDAVQPSHPLSSPSPPAPNPSQHQSLFQ